MSKNKVCLIYCLTLADGSTHFDTFTMKDSSSPTVPGENNLIDDKYKDAIISHFFRVYLK